jgi:hypothetical protein
MSLALMTKRNTGHWWVATYKSLRILSAVQTSLGRTWQTLSYRQASTPTEERASWSLWHDGHSNWTKGLSPNVPYCAAADTFLDISSILRTRGSFVLLLVGRGVTTIENVMPYPYYKPPTDHQGLHDAYIAIFDSINEHGKWTGKSPPKGRSPSKVLH